MKKDNCHDYVSEAYRFYALCGCPDAERLRRMRLNASDLQRADIQDLEAVSRVIERVRSEPDGNITLRCMEIIFFTQPKVSLSRGLMSERVTAAADELCVSESVVYRMLKRLRHMLAVERGLRIDGSQDGVSLVAAIP